VEFVSTQERESWKTTNKIFGSPGVASMEGKEKLKTKSIPFYDTEWKQKKKKTQNLKPNDPLLECSSLLQKYVGNISASTWNEVLTKVHRIGDTVCEAAPVKNCGAFDSQTGMPLRLAEIEATSVNGTAKRHCGR